jgi:hypothetical protein
LYLYQNYAQEAIMDPAKLAKLQAAAAANRIGAFFADFLVSQRESHGIPS